MCYVSINEGINPLPKSHVHYFVVACGPVSLPNNVTRVHYIDNTTRVGSTLQYVCFPGYLILGDDKRICQENRTWSGLEQQCQRMQ